MVVEFVEGKKQWEQFVETRPWVEDKFYEVCDT